MSFFNYITSNSTTILSALLTVSEIMGATPLVKYNGIIDMAIKLVKAVSTPK